jgi:glycosyltransferase involved in cell wall biosynthesis
MRIAHVSDCYLPRLGGIEVQVHDLAQQQLAAGHDVRILTSTPAPPRVSRPQSLVLGRDSPPVQRFPAGLSGLPSPGARAGLRQALSRGGFDVLHLHSSVLSPFAWAGARTAAELGLPAVLTMHSVLPPGRVLGLSDALGRWSDWPVVWSAVSDVAAAPLRQVLGETAVHVLANGIDPQAWHTSAPRRPGAELTVVSVMRLSRRKRPVALLRILAGLRELLPADVPLRAVLIGDGPQRAGLQRRLHSSGMDAWVTLTGRLSRDRIRPLLADADLYLAPAERESFGIAALEARCAGLPVVAMARGGVGEFIRDGVEGFLVGSDGEMARVSAELLGSDRLRVMQEHNRTSDPRMTWPQVVSASLDLYARAGASTPASRRDHEPAHA